MLGVESDEVSALYFLHYCKSGGGLRQMLSDARHGDQHLRCKTGYQSYAEGLAGLLTPGSVILSSPVTGIRQPGITCHVTTANNLAFRCKKIIVLIPTTLYHTIHFSAPLPDNKLALSSATKSGFFSKVVLVYPKPWWTEAGYAGLAHAFNDSGNPLSDDVGPLSLIRDTSDHEVGVYSLTCFVVSDAGRAWSQLPYVQRRSEVLNQLARIYPDVDRSLINSPVEVLEQEWSKEEFIEGTCPVTGPGVTSSVGHALREPFGGVHFVGSETSMVWKGHMEGAVRSGERGAAEVIQALLASLAGKKPRAWEYAAHPWLP